MEQNEDKNKIKAKKKRISGFEEWGGYMDAKKQKLNAQFDNRRSCDLIDKEEHLSNIFSGISIYVNGYTNPSAEELKKLMVLHGGKYHYYYSLTHTSHMVATNLPDSKIKALKGRKVVSPEWIVDSIKAKKLLPDNDYMLYTPEITDKQQRLKFSKVQSSLDNILKESSPDLRHTLNYSSSPSKGEDCKDKAITNIQQNIIPAKTQNLLPNTSSSITEGTSKLPVSFSAVNQSTYEQSASDTIISDKPLKAGDPNFISVFYNRSRLHHIATSRQELKVYVQDLAFNQKGKPFLQREKLKQQRLKNNYNFKSSQSKFIMHLDMDCFFVSVGLKNHPGLRGKPVAVTHSKGKRGMPQEGSNIEYEANYYFSRLNQSAQEFDDNEETIPTSNKNSKYTSDYGSLSEIASCSYEARKAGIKNGMFLGEALRLCPDLKTIPYDFEGYSEVSKLLYDIVTSYTLDIEAVSCDELYIDCTELLEDVKMSVDEFAHVLRSEIYEKTGCTASAGIGKNRLLARLATKQAKPNGQYILMDNEIDKFMKNQCVKDIPGIGYSTSSRLKQLGIKTCGELQNLSIFKLQQEFGPKTGQTLFEHCRGTDYKIVTLEKDRKSVSAEINYGIRFEQEQEIYNFINGLAGEVEQRLKKINRKGRSLTLKLMIRKENAPMQTAKFMGHGVCSSICKSTILKTATDDAKVIGQECCSIVKSLKIKPQDYRGLGIQMNKLESSMKDIGMKTIQRFLEKASLSNKSDTTEISNINLTSNTTEERLEMENESVALPLAQNPPNHNPQDAYYHQLSQMDHSVLNALPEEMQQEIRSAYSKKQGASPVKVSPVKANKPSHKRGCSTAAKSRKPSKSGSPQKMITDYQKAIPFKKVENTTSSSTFNASSVKKKVSLGDATEIDEVRELLKEWVSSVQEPIDEDINIFKNYMFELIEEDLEKTSLVLKQFHRLAKNANLNWREAYLLLLSYVQQKMLQDVGYMLKANDSFDCT